MDGDLRGPGGDVFVADAAGDVGAVEENDVAFELGLELDAGAGGELEEGLFFVEAEVVFDGFKGEGAVHGAGFEVQEAGGAGEMGGEGALAGTGGAVDGDNGALAGCRLGFFGGGEGVCGQKRTSAAKAALRMKACGTAEAVPLSKAECISTLRVCGFCQRGVYQ